MAGSQQAIKTRIKGIKTTRKITKAMELIAIGKLKRQRDLFEANRFYSNSVKDTIRDILSNTNDLENVYLQDRIDDNPITIVFISDLGLCGGYNANIMRLVLDEVPTGSQLIIVGFRGKHTIAESGYRVNKNDISCDQTNYVELAKIADQMIDDYINKKISSINIIYTKYVNSMSFQATKEKLLPITRLPKNIGSYKELLYEPNIDTILGEIVPLYIKSLFYNFWLESTTSEHSARRLAMDMATDNAEDLIEELTLEYNQARQASITQEINEIVMTADAI